ncbi:MAG: tRNA uridine-5-carboxymethylaminomethyl(34) synthesis GTPase MnmE [Gemmatimonadaceae bacterium]
MMLASDDTIVALATPAGRGAVALVRLSGPRAHEIARQHLEPWPGKARQVTLCVVRDADGGVLDHALATVFTGPHSFTGEDVVEIATHGGVVVPTLVAAALVRSGAREALAGEFTRRAALNGKLDILQAEAIGDLIDAGSRAMQRTAIAQLDGGLSRRIDDLRAQVIGLEALIAYDIDFPEEDDGPVSRERVEAALCELLNALNNLLATAPAGELVRSGAVVVIAGAPNAGKSSLFNAMLGSARAIVTAVPGTTRDAIEAVLDTQPWPLRLVDTAGLRETDDLVERFGIEVSERYLESADVVLACGDTDAAVMEATAIISRLTTGEVIGVRTKADLATSELSTSVSAATGAGLSQLVGIISRAISTRYSGIPMEAPVLTRERQRYAVETARDEVAAFGRAWDDGVPATVAAVHLRVATSALADVVGAVDIEDVLDRLFSSFCVGK